MATGPSSFVQRQHAEVSTDHSVLAELVRRAAGAGIKRLHRIVAGYDNEVYRVRCTDRQDVVVRILRFGRFAGDSTRSVTEAKAMEQARAVGVPAPEILLLDTVHLDGSDYPVMVQRAARGRPLVEVLDRLSESQQRELLTDIGGLIARLQQIQVDEEYDWQTVMTTTVANRRRQRDQISAGGFSPAQVDQMLELLEGYAGETPWQRWVLCHGDLGPQHIFVTVNGVVGVSGVIDFGDWKIGAPVHDLAVLRVRYPQLHLPSVLAGYGAPDDDHFRRRLDIHTIDIAMSSLWLGVTEADQPCIERSHRLIRDLLRSLE